MTTKTHMRVIITDYEIGLHEINFTDADTAEAPAFAGTIEEVYGWGQMIAEAIRLPPCVLHEGRVIELPACMLSEYQCATPWLLKPKGVLF